MLCPIINAAYNRQCSDGLNLLQSPSISHSGCWNFFLFVDGRTDEFHREDDCAYTFITIPKQVMNSNQHCSHQPLFLFKLNEEQKLILPMSPDLTFFYNASFLTHRQSYIPPVVDNSRRFYNISSYANEKLFNHLRLSFHRMK